MSLTELYEIIGDLHSAADDCNARAERYRKQGLSALAASYSNAAAFYSAHALRVKSNYNPCDYIEIDVVEM